MTEVTPHPSSHHPKDSGGISHSHTQTKTLQAHRVWSVKKKTKQQRWENETEEHQCFSIGNNKKKKNCHRAQTTSSTALSYAFLPEGNIHSASYSEIISAVNTGCDVV